MIRVCVSPCILFSGLAALLLGGCKRSPDARQTGQGSDSTAQAGSVPPDSARIGSTDADTTELGKVAPFPEDGPSGGSSRYYVPWEDGKMFSNPLSDDSAKDLTNAFFEAVKDQQPILHHTSAPDSSQPAFEEAPKVEETLDFRNAAEASISAPWITGRWRRM